VSFTSQRLAAERGRAAVAARTPLGSVGYDTAARQAVGVIESYLQLATAWEALVRRRYLVHCRRNGTEPVTLTFPALPSLPEETERLLTPPVPDGRQAGGFGFGTLPVKPAGDSVAPAAPQRDRPADTVAPAGATTAPEAAPAPDAGTQHRVDGLPNDPTDAGDATTASFPSPEEVQNDVRALGVRYRATPQPAARRRSRLAPLRFPRRRPDGASDPVA